MRSLPRLLQRVGPHPQLPSLSGQKECCRLDDIFNRSTLSQSSLIGPSSLQLGHCRELHMFCAGLPRTRPTVAEASVEKKGIYSNDCNFSEYPASDGKRLKAASQVETVREDIKLFGRTWRKSVCSVEIALTKLRWARRFPICPMVQMVSTHGQLRRPTRRHTFENMRSIALSVLPSQADGAGRTVGGQKPREAGGLRREWCQGRNRTTDTAIFRSLLVACSQGLSETAVGKKTSI